MASANGPETIAPTKAPAISVLINALLIVSVVIRISC